jgi:hypothetical protein
MTPRSRPRPGALPDVLPGIFAALGLPGHDPLGLAGELSGVRQIALLLIDGFGYHLMAEAAQAAPTIADIHEGRLGRMRSIVCGFPSTTPVSLVGLGSGSTPGGHGVMGFSVRVPATGVVLNHVRWGADPDPEVWQPLPTVFERAAAAGIRAVTVTKPEFEGSGLTRAAYRGAEFRGAERHEVAKRMLKVLGEGIPMVYGYHAELDHAGHVTGVGSDEWRDAARAIDRTIAIVSAALPKDAALVVTADHGQLNVPEDGKFDIDGDHSKLRVGVDTVAGEARLRYLHTAPGAADDVLAAWRETLGDSILAVPRDQAIDEGWYGPVTAEHAARLGDVIAVSLGDHAVVQSAVEPGEAALVGYHGGFSPVEADVPLIVIRGGG